MPQDSKDFDDMLAVLKNMYEEKLPFNRVLGFQVIAMDVHVVRVRFEMKPELIGNYVMGILHGGVISSVLDATGGMMASIGLLHKMSDCPLEDIVQSMARIGTIDLRVDFLRPGKGNHFIANGSLLRSGKKVAVSRMELHNDQHLLIAVGTGTYIVG